MTLNDLVNKKKQKNFQGACVTIEYERVQELMLPQKQKVKCVQPTQQNMYMNSRFEEGSWLAKVVIL